MNWEHFTPYTEYIVYAIPVATVVLVLSWIFIKVRYKFWATQPVFHVYDLKYYLSPPGIIRKSVPEKNKFFHPDIRFRDINGSSIEPAFCAFIRRCYMRNGANRYVPDTSNILPYFGGHSQKCYLSVLDATEDLVIAKHGRIVQRPAVVACMTSRPMMCEFEDPRGERDGFMCNYVDYLCVDETRRGAGIASQIIYTHEYHVQRVTGMPTVSVFKREGAFMGIVPICAYEMEGFDMRTWRPMPPLPANAGKVVRCTPATLYMIADFLRRRAKTDFGLYLGVSDGNLAEIIRTENVYIYLYVDASGAIASAYFFRHTCTWFSEGEQVLACFASVRGDTDEVRFAHAFKSAVTHIMRTDGKRRGYKVLLMENVANNDTIITNLKQRTAVSFREPAAYFFYNFAYRTFPANRCLIIN